MRRETLPLIHDYSIRYLTLADHAQVQELYNRCADYINLISGTDPGITEAQSIFTALPPGKTYNDKFLLGILTSGQEQLLGLLDIFRDFPVSGEWYLRLLLIDPQKREQGLGGLFYRTFEHWAAEHGAHTICLSIVKQNEAEYRFWTCLGFQETRQAPVVDDHRSTNVMMQRNIEPQNATP
jgi:GNAT superfamily N-acetyltransferase